MGESNDSSSLKFHFQSKKLLLTTPIKTITMGHTLFPSDRSNTNLITQIRNQNFTLSAPRGFDLQEVEPCKLFESGSVLKKKLTSILPEKYEMICDIFIAVVNSIRLLRMKGMPATLTKLVSNIESLTDRRFTLHHLAQLKFILPEVIVIKKIRVQNEKTNCMQEDLLLSLEMDALEIDENAKGGNGFIQLKKIFQSRVYEFFKTHLEDDIPEGELPPLFHQPNKETEPNLNITSSPLVTSLIDPSFKKRFSFKQLDSRVSESTQVNQSTFLSEMPIKEANSAGANDGCFGSPVAADEALMGLVSTPSKQASIPQKSTSTPSELASTPAKLMAATPALCEPKRTLMISNDDTCELTNKSSKRKSLKFNESNVDIECQLIEVDEGDNIIPGLGSAITKDDVLAVLPENLLQSLMDKEVKIMKEKDPIVTQAQRRQQMMAGVPKLFDMIRLLFQSLGRTVITKDELIYKLLSGHMDIIDRIEVEEQLKLLEELAPEYITEKISLSGDTLISVNKRSSPDSICAKLLEAI